VANNNLYTEAPGCESPTLRETVAAVDRKLCCGSTAALIIRMVFALALIVLALIA